MEDPTPWLAAAWPAFPEPPPRAEPVRRPGIQTEEQERQWQTWLSCALMGKGLWEFGLRKENFSPRNQAPHPARSAAAWWSRRSLGQPKCMAPDWRQRSIRWTHMWKRRLGTRKTSGLRNLHQEHATFRRISSFIETSYTAKCPRKPGSCHPALTLCGYFVGLQEIRFARVPT